MKTYQVFEGNFKSIALIQHGHFSILTYVAILLHFYDFVLDIVYCYDLVKLQMRILMILWISTFLYPMVNACIDSCKFSKIQKQIDPSKAGCCNRYWFVGCLKSYFGLLDLTEGQYIQDNLS